VSWPRIAAVGGTRLASSAGTAAAINDSGSPIAIAIHTWPIVKSGVAAAAAMYNVLTVEAVSVTAASASSRARPRPITMPIAASAAASPRNSHNTLRRVSPSARKVPISWRRATTEMVIVL
jgi:hypothetical protein